VPCQSVSVYVVRSRNYARLTKILEFLTASRASYFPSWDSATHFHAYLGLLLSNLPARAPFFAAPASSYSMSNVTLHARKLHLSCSHFVNTGRSADRLVDRDEAVLGKWFARATIAHIGTK
jgi:hypothetical protein